MQGNVCRIGRSVLGLGIVGLVDYLVYVWSCMYRSVYECRYLDATESEGEINESFTVMQKLIIPMT